MAQKKKKVLPQEWRTAFMSRQLAVDGDEGNKEAGTGVTVEQKKYAGGQQDTKCQKTEDGGDKPRPAGERHAHQCHAFGAHVESGGDEVQRAHQRAEAEESNADDP